MIKTSSFQIQIVCSGCNNYHALSGITAADTCQNCGKSINVSGVLNDKMFGLMDRVRYMNGFLSGSVEQMGGTGAYKLVYSSMQPYCEECFVPLDMQMLIDSIEKKQPVSCANCSHKMPVRGADAEVREFHPKTIGVINDSYGVDDSQKNTDKEAMFVFKCMTCGAGLELTSDTKRTIKCKYCDNENYLPDSIWGKLHANKETQPLFLLLELDENDIAGTVDYFLSVTSFRIYSKHFENFIREYFEKPFINEAVIIWFKSLVAAKNSKQVSFNLDIGKIQKYFYNNLKLGISSHSDTLKETVAEHSANLPVDLQSALADDKNENVRTALAKNQNLTKEVIKKLQGDSSSAVSSIAKKHKTGLFKSLFG